MKFLLGSLSTYIDFNGIAFTIKSASASNAVEIPDTRLTRSAFLSFEIVKETYTIPSS